jgi:hypothetical protein
MLDVGPHFECHEIAEIEPPGLIETMENIVRRSDQAQVDILGSAGALKTKLQDESAFQDRRVAYYLGDAREETGEH